MGCTHSGVGGVAEFAHCLEFETVLNLPLVCLCGFGGWHLGNKWVKRPPRHPRVGRKKMKKKGGLPQSSVSLKGQHYIIINCLDLFDDDTW